MYQIMSLDFIQSSKTVCLYFLGWKIGNKARGCARKRMEKLELEIRRRSNA